MFFTLQNESKEMVETLTSLLSNLVLSFCMHAIKFPRFDAEFYSHVLAPFEAHF